MSEFAESQFMNSEFNDSHLGTEYSTYGNSELAGQEGDAGGGGSRLVGTREWARQQRSQNSSQFTADSGPGPWSGPGRQTSGLDGGRQQQQQQHRGRGKYAGEDGRMHDLPPMPDKKQMPSNHSVLSHDLSGFSDFDPTPKNTHFQRDSGESVGSGGASGDITAPHPAPSDRINWNRGLTGAAAAAADADARNLVRKQQREREAAAEMAQKRAAQKAALSAGAGGGGTADAAVASGGGGGSDGSGSDRKKPRPPAAHSGPPDPRKTEANGAAVRDMGDMKEEGSGSGMSAFRANALEVRERERNYQEVRLGRVLLVCPFLCREC